MVSVHHGNVTNPVSALSVKQGRGVEIIATTMTMAIPQTQAQESYSTTCIHEISSALMRTNCSYQQSLP